MSDTWKQWEGQIVNRQFPLLRYLGGSEHCAVFLTERHEGELPVKAAIKLISATPADGELQLSRWQQAAELSHPHLIPLYEIGRFELGGTLFVYVVMECAEENLAQVLPGRALTPDEAHTLLESILEVLAYLHREGFVHGHIKPANIMASGDQLKVSSDGLRRAGESLDGLGDRDAYDAPENAGAVVAKSQPISPASDVWSLGMTLVETLTQNLPVARTAEQQDPLLPRTVPEPFLDIARHCLLHHPQRRWTVAQIAAILGGRAPVPEVQIVPPEDDTPVSPPKQIDPHSGPLAKRHGYAIPIAVGFVLVLTAVLLGPRILRRHAESLQVPTMTDNQPLVPPTANQVPAPPQERPSKSYTSSVPEEARSSKTPVPVPALIHPETMHEEETDTVARSPLGSNIRGEVAHQVLPEVLRTARNSIRGTVRVRVRVNVNRSGNVEDAELESRGPSKYFAQVALKAAQDWKFKAPMVDGRGGLSTWILQFQFTRDEDTVVPVQELP